MTKNIYSNIAKQNLASKGKAKDYETKTKSKAPRNKIESAGDKSKTVERKAKPDAAQTNDFSITFPFVFF